MFHSETKLPHLLSPELYCSQGALAAEQIGLFQDGWHLLGAASELTQDGSFLTGQIAGRPVHVRNFSGQLRALSNVCAHRHALISSSPCGRTEKMRCQYHGWEYQSDGTTGKIPLPKNFVPFDKQALRLPVYHVEQLGQLVFVSVSESPPPLREFLGEPFAKILAERFDDRWRLGLAWRPQYGVNWKIPVENSLEAYHVPTVHPHTFRVDPGTDRTEHFLGERYTSMSTQLPFSPHSSLDNLFQKTEATLMRFLGLEVTNSYTQHHVFPNLLFSFTDAISLAHCILPASPTSSTATVFQFSRLPHQGTSLKSLVAIIWGRLKAAITRKILQEDLAIYEPIQAGLSVSPHPGVLGICEERIHRFQHFMQQTCHYHSPTDNANDTT